MAPKGEQIGNIIPFETLQKLIDFVANRQPTDVEAPYAWFNDQDLGAEKEEAL